MTDSEILKSLSPFAGSEEFDSTTVEAHLQITGERDAIVQSLTEQMTSGRLSNEVWLQITHNPKPRDFERAFASLWEKLWNWQLRGEAEGYPDKWSKGALRIWAYTESWILISQDEDLLLMDETLMPEMLEIAAEPNCPKGEYLKQIAAHWARDWAFAFIGKPEFCNLMQRIGNLVPAVSSAGDANLAKYFTRLASYGLPASVSEAEAVQRGLDLTRCSAPNQGSVVVRRDGSNWLVTLPGIHMKTVLISSLDGGMREVAKPAP